jgi:putative endonuclease
MTDRFVELAYARARAAQQQQLKRRRAADKRAAKIDGDRATRAATTPRLEPASEVHASPTQRVGAAHEDRALERLTAAGLTPLARNVRCRTGEIDLIMREGELLVFVEVRARSNLDFGGAAASVGPVKRDRLVRSASLLLPSLARRYWNGRTPLVRFDVVAFDGEDMVWLRAAFHA